MSDIDIGIEFASLPIYPKKFAFDTISMFHTALNLSFGASVENTGMPGGGWGNHTFDTMYQMFDLSICPNLRHGIQYSRRCTTIVCVSHVRH